MKPAKRNSQSGFTLLEVLVTLVLASLVLAGMPSALRLASAGFRQASAAVTSDEMDRALDLIEQKLGGAIPIFEHSPDGLLNIAFQGNAQAVSFVAPLQHATDSGLFRYTLSAVVQGERGSDIVLTLQPYQPNSAELPIVEQRVLRRNATLNLRYLVPSTKLEEAKWVSEWRSRDNLPKLVALTIGQPPAPQQDRIVELHLRNPRELN